MDEAANQIAFADTILLNKIDLVSPEDLSKAREMVRAVNMTAHLMECQLSGENGESKPTWDMLMNVNSFSIERALQVPPVFVQGNLICYIFLLCTCSCGGGVGACPREAVQVEGAVRLSLHAINSHVVPNPKQQKCHIVGHRRCAHAAFSL